MRRTSKVVSAFAILAILGPARLIGAPWQFVVVGDSRGNHNGVNTPILSEIAAEIVARDADFVLFPGDLVTGSTSQIALRSQLTNWVNTMQPVYDAGVDVYPCRGNHDTGSKTVWDEIFSGTYALPANGPTGQENVTFSASHNNAFILGLDQYVTRHRVNQTWVNAQLAQNNKPHVFAFGHEPAFKAQHADCLDDYPSNRDTFLASLEGANARTYFAGHDHFYDHARIDDDGDPSNDIHQFIVGTAGAPLREWTINYDGSNSGYTVANVNHAKQYGYMLCEVDGLEVTLTWTERVSAGTYEAAEVWSYTAVPEPTGLLLLALGSLATATGRHRRAPGTSV